MAFNLSVTAQELNSAIAKANAAAPQSTTYTKNEVDAALSGKQPTLTTAQQAAVDSGITAAKVQQHDKDSAALIQQVDGGAKNLLPNSLHSATQGETTFTVNDDGSVTVVVSSPVDEMIRYVRVAANLTLAAGTYVLSGCPAGGSSSSYNLYIDKTPNNIEDNGTGASFTLNEKTILQYVTIALRRNTPAGTYVFKPMICTAADWAVSHKFVPYAPTNRVLYKETVPFPTDITEESQLDELSQGTITTSLGASIAGYAAGTWVVIRTYDLNAAKSRKMQIIETQTGGRKTRFYNGAWGSWT